MEDRTYTELFERRGELLKKQKRSRLTDEELSELDMIEVAMIRLADSE